MRRAGFTLTTNSGVPFTSTRRRRTTDSALVREAVRERYLGDHELRKRAMEEFVGSLKDAGTADAVSQVRAIRSGHRLERSGKA